MQLPFSLSALTVVHTTVSVVALVAGFFVLRGLFASRRPDGGVVFFLAAMAVTDATSFMFNSQRVGPGHIVGAVSLIVLLPTVLASTVDRMSRAWRWIYVGGLTTLVYLDALIAVLQLFAKVPALRAGGMPVLLAMHLVLLVVFLWLGWRAGLRFRPDVVGPDFVTGLPSRRALPATHSRGNAFSRRPVVLSPPGPGGQPRQAA